MSKPSNINEIRIEIDKIDLKILNLIIQKIFGYSSSIV